MGEHNLLPHEIVAINALEGDLGESWPHRAFHLTQDVSSPIFVGQFGKPVVIDQGDMMRIEAVASAPDKDGNSFTSVKLQLFENGEMRALKEMSMLADLSKSPSVEYTVPGTNARFTFRPSLVKLPEARKGEHRGRCLTRTLRAL